MQACFSFLTDLKSINMKTPEDFVNEYYQLPQSKIETVKIKSLIKCIERYKEYHDSEVKKLNMPDVVGRSEQLKCDGCGIQTDAGSKMFLCEHCGQEHPKAF
jgi:hypothetical protein